MIVKLNAISFLITQKIWGDKIPEQFVKASGARFVSLKFKLGYVLPLYTGALRLFRNSPIKIKNFNYGKCKKNPGQLYRLCIKQRRSSEVGLQFCQATKNERS